MRADSLRSSEPPHAVGRRVRRRGAGCSVSLFKRPKPDLREYLYVDDRRVNSYLEQISSTDTYDRVPSLQFGVSGDGNPSMRFEYSKQRRPKNQHALVTELVSHLDRRGKLGRARPRWGDSSEADPEPTFVLETCEAVKVLFPDTKGDAGSGVVAWLSEWPTDRRAHALRPAGVLCMIEDATSDDRVHRASFSSYSWLLALLHQLHLQPTRTALAAQFSFAQDGEYGFDLLAAHHELHPDAAVFRPNPVQWLKQKGCVVSPEPRRVTALYRIRNQSTDEIATVTLPENFTISTFAYAIAVWATP